jgi:hypothetical protein
MAGLACQWLSVQVGNCGVECKTAERAAERIMGEHDTDVAEVLYAVGGWGGRAARGAGLAPAGMLCCIWVSHRELSGCSAEFLLKRHLPAGQLCAVQGKKDASEFTNWLCHELTGVCNTPPPLLPKVSWAAIAARMHCWW